MEREKETGDRQYGEFQKRALVVRMDMDMSHGGL
jgi:hypothetical protein